MDLVAAVRQQAGGCARLGSPMYAGLCDRIADDLEAGGPSAALLADHRDAPGPDAVALRLLGSVHRLVLERRAGALAAYYPSVGGTWEPDAGWTAFRDLLADQPGAVAEWLDRPPQTNEVGRATALMAGLRTLGGPVRLFEIGSSAGLLLLADHYRYVAEDGSAWGPAASPVVLRPAWTGPAPRGEPRIVERVGSDVMPVDPRSTEGRLTLTAYVWPDQLHRHERLRGALDLAARVPYEVRRQGASELVDSIEPADGATTVLWHSVMWQYLPGEEQAAVTARIGELGAAATPSAPFAHLELEPQRPRPGAPHEFLVVLQTWPGGERRVLGTAAGHGVPTRCD
ncbi:DUF2332 domain-containing protein [Nocardioides dongkuii]|uniref:DUF2332 domain-containing protein n=1 Tax=Nocardioides dongkuii TaxID=2760089 RepID=UPI0015FAA1EC|nr:DUF2332 domain-containing protein [Nocardioides dongkuii]